VGRYDGKVVALTGVASGMGRASAIRIASEGGTVFSMDINAEGLAATAAQITDAGAGAGGTITTRVTDISDHTECAAAIQECVDTHGRLDVLGNFAAISWMRNTPDVTFEEWRRMFAINVDGTYFMCQAALPRVLAAEGNIVNIASNAASMGQAYLAPYCATKGAVAQLTRALAMEYVKQPIRINAIAPGGTDTAMNANYELAADTDFDLLQAAMGHRGFGQPEDIAALFAFLASDDAGNIHGSIINSDNGLTAS
jgi:meso-butanediol dehydrogenase/(S,S)-butanediol dehydrogenase/diacetyl reductase